MEEKVSLIEKGEQQENLAAIQTPSSLIIKRFLKNKLAVIGLVV